MSNICGSICSSVFMLGGLLWCGGLLWLVVSAVVYRCDLMCRLIKVHTRGCVGSQIRLAGCVSIGKYVAQLTLFVWGWGGRMARSKNGFGLPRDCSHLLLSFHKIL